MGISNIIGTANAASWRTTSASALKLLGMFILVYAVPKLGGQDVSISGLFTPENMTIIGAVVTGVGELIHGIVGRDAKVSSQESGIRSEPEAKMKQVAAEAVDEALDR